ncbi:hypothetical protein Tco_0163557, partial [Tanacetum coccineum]
KELQEVIAIPILSDNMEKAPTELNLSITSNDINIELSKEFLVELRKNIYHGTYNEDVVDHIAKNGGLVKEMKKSPLRRNLLRNSSVDSIPNHTMEKKKCWTKEKTRGLIHLNSYQTIMSNNELKESKYENPPNTATDSFFKAYEARDIEKQCQTKRKYSNTSNSINEQPNKKRCKVEKFEAIQYSLGPNEEYIAIRSYEYDIWERNEDNMSNIYQDIFQMKDEGWMDPPEKKIDDVDGEFTKSRDPEVLES